MKKKIFKAFIVSLIVQCFAQFVVEMYVYGIKFVILLLSIFAAYVAIESDDVGDEKGDE